MKLKTAPIRHAVITKFTLCTLLTLSTLISLSSHAATLTAEQQQAVKSHFDKLAQSQQVAEQRLTEQLDQEFTRQLAQEEHQFMRQTCTQYGMAFDVTSNACLRS